MNSEIRIAKLNGKYAIIAAIIGGVCTIIGSTITLPSNYKLRNESNILQSKNSELMKQINTLQEDNEEIFNKFESLEKEYDSLFNEINTFNINTTEVISEKDIMEIDVIIKRMNDFKEYTNAFPNLKIDSYELELMYKLFLSEEYYKYDNLILAFEKYGIDCEELSINESVLELWDLEILYTYYNIIDNIEDIEDKQYPFNSYKMDKIDTFNYKNYGMDYNNETYDFIYSDMNKRINKIIRKLNSTKSSL